MKTPLAAVTRWFLVAGDHPVLARRDAIAAEEGAQFRRRVAGVDQHQDRRARLVPVTLQHGEFGIREIVFGRRQHDAGEVGGDVRQSGQIEVRPSSMFWKRSVSSSDLRGEHGVLGVDAALIGEQRHLARLAFDRFDKPGGQQILALETGELACSLGGGIDAHVFGDAPV